MQTTILSRVLFAILILGHSSVFAAFEVVKNKFDNGVVANEAYYRDGQLVEHRFYNTQGVFMTWVRYKYPEAGHVIKALLSTEKESFGQIKNQEEWIGLDEKNSEKEGAIRLKKWVYTDEVPYRLQYVEHYDRAKKYRVIQKDYRDESDKLISSIFLSYDGDAEKPYKFVEKDAQGRVISQFSMYEPYDLEGVLQKNGKSAAEIAVLKKLRENPNKFLIAIIDSGFDYNHVELVTKWWNNPLDPVDGKDNDGNGWVDDNFGWEQVKNVGLPTESSTAMDRDERPLSHGTHVAHIAIRGLDNAALVGFAGDYTQASYINKVSEFIKKHHVRVVNMSIGLPHDNKDLLGLRDAIKAYGKMIDENPDTLFVVASGNSEQDLDDMKNRQYPASFTQANVLKVGALDASDYSTVTPQNAKMAYFSNYGLKNVDVLVPGMKVVAASLGGGLIAHSGTSMATPLMVNMVARLWSELPHLKAAEVRDLFIRTAQVMTPRAPVLSGGYADLPAALMQGKLEFLNGKNAKSSGPNCWNSATYLAGISEGLHHTYGSEFAFLLGSPLCKNIPLEQMQKGDIVALRRFDRNGKLLPAAFLSEVHGYTYLGDGKGLSKNGVDASAPYVMQDTKDILQFYKSSEYKNCKINGLERQDCNLKETAYRCTDIETYAQSRGGLTVFERDILQRISLLEKHVQSELFYGQKLTIDKEKMIAALEKDIEKLKDFGSSDFMLDYFQARLDSLGARF